VARRHRLGALLLCVGVGATAYFAFHFAFRVMQDLLIDDAYIVLRHSENFARSPALKLSPKDLPVMPLVWHSFKLRPNNFFDRNPAIDLRNDTTEH
jgi:hypothetical protein